jgi:CRP/FNR family transcriptional regulator
MKVAPVSDHVQSQLLAIARPITQPKGAVLFRRDEPTMGIFLLRKGSVSLRLEAEGGEAILARTAMQGSVIGLPATLSGGRYSLTAVTLEECELAQIDRSALLEFIQENAAIGLELLCALGEEVNAMRTVLASRPVLVHRLESVPVEKAQALPS